MFWKKLYCLCCLYCLYCLYYIILLYCYIIIPYYTVFALRGKLKNIGGVSPARKAKPPPVGFWDLCRTHPERRQGTDARFAVRLVQALQGARAGGGYTYPTHTHKIDYRQFWGIVGGVSLSGIMGKRSSAKNCHF